MLQKRRNSLQIAKGRDFVLSSFEAAKRENDYEFTKGNVKATSEYIYENQIIDANQIVREFYENDRTVSSVSKRTKVGMDGLMIYLAYLMTTHIDDGFIMDPANVRIITGMSNAGWEKDMKEKVPKVFEKSIFHHGQIQNANLTGLKNGLIIIDEIDTGNGTGQKLHNALAEAGLLDIKYLKENNIRIMVDSATMMQELYELMSWGDRHINIKMTIPSEYIGHGDFLRMGIIKEFYPLNTPEAAAQWVQEDIVENYGTDYRVHIVRLTERGAVNRETIRYLSSACVAAGVVFRNHTSSDRLSDAEITEFFEEPLTHHIVLGVKGFFRRANLIPNKWKLRIGATHELYTKKVDNNVQVQGLPGRMSGYWRSIIEGGHKTGPHRTSIKAIEEYEQAYEKPFDPGNYGTSTFTKTVRGRVSAEASMLHPQNIANLEAVDGPELVDERINPESFRVFDNFDTVRKYCEKLGYKVIQWKDKDIKNGFIAVGLNAEKAVASLDEAALKVSSAYGGSGTDESAYRTYLPCYTNTSDSTTLRFVVIIRPSTNKELVAEADQLFPSMPYLPPKKTMTIRKAKAQAATNTLVPTTVAAAAAPKKPRGRPPKK